MPAPLRRQYVDSRWGQIHLHVAGNPGSASKRPLLCFHLSPGSGRMYMPFLAAMGEDRLAMVADTPGYGTSNAPPAPPSHVADYAAALGDIIDALDLPQVDLMGAHTGSRLAVELAHQRPDRVGRLILFGAAVYTPEERARQKQTYVSGRQGIVVGENYLTKMWKGWSSWRGADVTDDMIWRYVVDSVIDPVRSWWAHGAVFEHDLGARLKALPNEVMVLCVKDDIFEPTQRARGQINRGTYVERSDWGHWFLETRTAEFAAIARTFLDRN